MATLDCTPLGEDDEPLYSLELPSLSDDGIPYFHGVYAIRNRITGGMYVGATKSLRQRWQAHVWALRAGRHSDPLFQAAWNEHGIRAFELVAIESVPLEGRLYGMEPALREAEQRWLIDLMECGADLYNRTLPKAPPISVVKWNPETMLPKPAQP